MRAWCSRSGIAASSFQSVRAKLTDDSEATLKTLKDSLTKDPRVQVGRANASPSSMRNSRRSCRRSSMARAGSFAIMMGLAAIFAAVNTMFNAVASRVREIATLRAMGFGAMPVVFSVLFEAMVLGAAGGLLGGLLAFVFLNGMQSSTMNFQTFSQITYAFTVTPQLMVTGIIYGLVLTFIAGVLPGIRAARMPITSGLARIVMRRTVVAVIGALALAGASFVALAQGATSTGPTSKAASSTRTTPTTRAR